MSEAATGPAMTVVVVPLVGGAALDRCLAALREQGDAVEEILVVSNTHTSVAPFARVVACPQGATVPERRLIGFNAARSAAVAFLEDTCLPASGWAEALRDALRGQDVWAAGGPVLIPASLAPQTKALAIIEYSRFSSAPPDGVATATSFAGANFALRRAAFADVDWPDGLIDNAMFEHIRRQGGRMVLAARASARFWTAPKEYTSLKSRFDHGRIYGGGFCARRPPGARLLHALAATAAPAILMARTLKDAGRHLLSSPRTLAWAFLMQCAWGCGEVVGKLTGKTGDSLRGWT